MENTEFENAYFLKSRQVDSPVTNAYIRHYFERRMFNIGFRDFTKDGMKKTYTVDDIQNRWEEFYNGFRLGEDAQ